MILAEKRERKVYVNRRTLYDVSDIYRTSVMTPNIQISDFQQHIRIGKQISENKYFGGHVCGKQGKL